MSQRHFVNNPAYIGAGTIEESQTAKPEEAIYDTLLRENIEKLPLPEGWSEKKTDDGRVYYSCSITRHTQWLHPSIPVGIIMPNGLPYGWEKGIHPETGQDYYICHLGRYNTWAPPTPRRREFYES